MWSKIFKRFKFSRCPQNKIARTPVPPPINPLEHKLQDGSVFIELFGGEKPHVSADNLPPLTRPNQRPHLNQFHIGIEQVRLMRKLRFENPREWSLKKLAKKFNCTSELVARYTPRSHQDPDFDHETYLAKLEVKLVQRRLAFENQTKYPNKDP